MTSEQVVTAVQEAQGVGDTILEIVKQVDPGVAVEGAMAEEVLNLAAQMVVKAMTAYTAAGGDPITAETIAKLAPNPIPLSAPDAK